MIAIICAMDEERDAVLKVMTDVKTKKAKKLNYQRHILENDYYIGKIGNKDVVLERCGIGKIYATLVTTNLINKFKPELVINLGCAGSLKEDVYVGDTVIADRVGDWEMDVPWWQRSITSEKSSYEASKKILSLIKKSETIHIGPIVSSDSFIYKKSQLNIIKKYFPTALAGEMEGSAVAGTCYANGVEFTVIRTISDSTLVKGNDKQSDLNLIKTCDKSAKIVKKIIEKY